jgi:hypothetical protein
VRRSLLVRKSWWVVLMVSAVISIIGASNRKTERTIQFLECRFVGEGG